MTSSRRRWRLGLVLLLVTLALRAPLLMAPHAVDDEVVYAVVANEILAGGQPYVDAVERKPPLLFWTYAAIFGLFGPFNWLALHAVSVAWVLLTMAGIYVITRRLFDVDVGATGALLYAVYQVWGTWNNLAFNGEVMMNLPIVWAYALVFGRQRMGLTIAVVMSGVLVGIASLLKQPAIIVALPLAFYVYRLPSRETLRSPGVAYPYRPVLLLLGLSLTLSAIAALLYRQGLLSEAWYWTVGDHDVPRVFWAYGAKKTLAFLCVCAPLVAGALASVTSTRLWSGRTAERDALVGLTAVSTIGALSTGRFFGHYYIAIVLPLAILAAPVIADIRVVWPWRATSMRPVWMTRAVIAVTAIIFLSLHTVGLAGVPDDTDAGRYLRSHASPGDRLFIWGKGTRIYLDARLRPATRYIDTFPLTGRIFGPNDEDITGETESRVLQAAWMLLPLDFAKHPPTFIVDAESGPDARYPMARFPVLRRIVSHDYRPVANTAEGVIYRRNAPTRATDLDRTDPIGAAGRTAHTNSND